MNKPGIAARKERLLWALNAGDELDFMSEDALREAVKDLPVELIEERRKGLRQQIEWIRDGLALVAILGVRVPQCACGKFFIAKRGTQTRCQVCSKRISQKNWRSEYERTHGSPYKQKREAPYITRVREALKGSSPASLSIDDQKDLAAALDVSLPECEAALQVISEKRVPLDT